ncbi:MAG: energy-coupling factor transporter transmembrane component T [Staphylococcus lugdunensis]|nr:energy-coupling factor transporter transmembrane component T [Staphylococcus lugdunensis]
MSKISSLFKDDRTRLAQLDPRTKILLTITVSTILISSGSSQSILRITITLCSLILLLSIYKYLAFLKFTMLFVILMLLQAYVVPYTHGMLQFILLACVGIFMNMLPGFIVGYFTLYSTKVSEFIAAMEKIKMPRNVIIPITVIFRFFPTISEEYRNINHAMKMRGITLRRHIFKNLEYRLIPLIISVVQIGNDLSFAAMTRGIDAPHARTNICTVKFKWLDMVFFIVMLALWVNYYKEKLS